MEEKQNVQKVYVDDSFNLVVEINNAIIKKDGITTPISGDFSIDDVSVTKLLAILNEYDVSLPYKEESIIRSETCPWIVKKRTCVQRSGRIVTKKEIAEKMDRLEEVSCENIKLKDEIKQLKSTIEYMNEKYVDSVPKSWKEKYEQLVEKIVDFNTSRRPWERELKIE